MRLYSNFIGKNYSYLNPDIHKDRPHLWLDLRHSYLSASTGFLVAALQLWYEIVNNAIPKAIKPANAKTHQLNTVLYAKFSSHLFII